MNRVVAFLLAILVFVFAGEAQAHGSRTAYLDVVQTGAGEAIASLRSGPRTSFVLSSPDCAIEPLPSGAASQSVAVAHLRCPRGLSGATLEVGGMVDGADVVIARIVLEHGDAHGAVLTTRSPRVVVPVAGSDRAVLAHYARLGVEHVLSGLDHVLFLLALVWQAHAASRGALRPWASELFRAATAFTVAHTLTLTATALGWIHVPPEVAEILIAVSLVLVALDVATERAGANRLGVVMTFGLVHGLGFAAALSEARLPEGAIALGLVAFNVGVEVGQVLLLACAAAVIALVPRVLAGARTNDDRRDALRARAAIVSAYVIGVTGAYLVIARASSLFTR